jgi:hypothetical protein
VAVQGVSSSSAPVGELGSDDADYRPSPWMRNTCHLWAEGGPAERKLALGWRPGTVWPVPPLAEFEAAAASTPAEEAGG